MPQRSRNEQFPEKENLKNIENFHRRNYLFVISQFMTMFLKFPKTIRKQKYIPVVYTGFRGWWGEGPESNGVLVDIGEIKDLAFFSNSKIFKNVKNQ